MMDNDHLAYLAYISLGACAVFVAFFCLYVVLLATTENVCLAKGWREASVSISLKRYCVTRVDQSDIIKPLAEAEQR